MKPLIVICSIIIFLTVGILIFNHAMKALYSEHLSMSMENAKIEKIFVKEIKIQPDQLVINNNVINFKECWIEKKSKIKYKFLLFRTVEITKPDSFYICFNLKKPIPYDLYLKDLNFKANGSKHVFASSYLSFYYDELNSLDSKKITVEILENLKGKKEKITEVNFTF